MEIAFQKSEEITIQRNTLLNTIANLYPSHQITFEINPKSFLNGWQHVLRLTGTDNNCCNRGDRHPSVYIRPNGEIYIARTKDSSDTRYSSSPLWEQQYTFTDTNHPLPLNQWTSLKIEQTLIAIDTALFAISIDGVDKYSITLSPNTWTNVKVYAGDPFNDAANATIRNLKIINIRTPKIGN